MCAFKDVLIKIDDKYAEYVDESVVCYVTQTHKNIYIEATRNNRKVIESKLHSRNSKKHPSRVLESLLLRLYFRRHK